ncbi:MAG: hypothetical protein U5N56_01820 [Candidatus Marinimicrobia bacterium]|nr:hypothetical protein [Candidatus Neomarinimicrobiota bacterium]
MLTSRFLIMLFLYFSGAAATNIDFSNQYIFFRTGVHDDSTEYWTISNHLNDMSNIHFGVLTPETQLRLINHQFEIYIDEGDSILDYEIPLSLLFRYRYPCIMDRDGATLLRTVHPLCRFSLRIVEA